MTEPMTDEQLEEWERDSQFVVDEVDVTRHNLRRALRKTCQEIHRLQQENEKLFALGQEADEMENRLKATIRKDREAMEKAAEAVEEMTFQDAWKTARHVSKVLCARLEAK